MGSVFVDMAMSLDGFIAGPDQHDHGLHDWYFAPSAQDQRVIDDLFGSIGAMILGKGVFGDQPNGFETPYKVPHFVLTHQARPPVENTGVTFTFVADGIQSALAQAQTAAGEKGVCIAGGAQTVQQFLRAGLIDELHLHVVSKLLGGGLRLFGDGDVIALERTRVVESSGVTHV